MKKKKKMQTAYVLWVDDKIGRREGELRLLNSETLKVEGVGPGGLEKKLASGRIPASRPCLFLVDYFLDRGPVDDSSSGVSGPTAAGQIRTAFPELPVYLVSAQLDQREDFVAWDWFDRVIGLNMLQGENGGNVLHSDAVDYFLLRKARRGRRKPGELVRLFHVPESSRKRFVLALPEELRDGIGKGARPPSPGNPRFQRGDVLFAARWIRETLMTEPGLLFDRLSAATFLGMTIPFFEGKAGTFKEASYKGLFWRTCESLWWSSVLAEILFEGEGALEMDSANPWEVAPKVFKVPEEDMPHCVVCGELYPETVGIDIEIRDKEVRNPVHYACSEAHPGKLRRPQSDEMRAYRTE